MGLAAPSTPCPPLPTPLVYPLYASYPLFTPTTPPTVPKLILVKYEKSSFFFVLRCLFFPFLPLCVCVTNSCIQWVFFPCSLTGPFPVDASCAFKLTVASLHWHQITSSGMTYSPPPTPTEPHNPPTDRPNSPPTHSNPTDPPKPHRLNVCLKTFCRSLVSITCGSIMLFRLIDLPSDHVLTKLLNNTSYNNSIINQNVSHGNNRNISTKLQSSSVQMYIPQLVEKHVGIYIYTSTYNKIYMMCS